MRKIKIELIAMLVLGGIISICIMGKSTLTNALLFFIAYESLMYPIFNELENKYYKNKKWNMISIKSSSNSKLLEYRINNKLGELNKENFTIVDVKITQTYRRNKIINEAYIIYY